MVVSGSAPNQPLYCCVDLDQVFSKTCIPFIPAKCNLAGRSMLDVCSTRNSLFLA